jgi:serine/threonine protein kinase
VSQEVIAGRFEIEAEVASGGMGTIFRGRDLQALSAVAIKLLNLRLSKDAERFEREAALLAQVSHPGIVRYLSHGTTEQGQQFLVMEWVEGQTVKDILAEKGLSIPESVETARRVAEGLAEMHQRGIIHRDIKPSNLIYPGGAIEQVKILDFGIARKSDDLVGLTRTGFLVGSPGYMAPEQVRGDRAAMDARVDLFALGCVLYECLTGRASFFGDPLAVRAKVLLTEPMPVRQLNPEVSPALESLVGQLLSKDPGRRPQRAAQVAAQLSTLRESPGARRPSASAVNRTEVARPATRPDVVFTFLLCAAVQTSNGEESPQVDRVQELTSTVERHGGRLECLDDQWWMVVLSGKGPRSGEAARAAKCALELRSLLPDVPMALIAEKAGRGLELLIDRAVSALTTESLATIFAQTLASSSEAGGIRLDQTTAELLSERFQVTRGPEGLYLRAEQRLDSLEV